MAKNSNKKSGTVLSFNVSPKGNYEGLLVECDGERIQANFPQEWSATVAEIARPGGSVELKVGPREVHGDPAHAVYELIEVSNDAKKKFSMAGPHGVGDGRFSGKVERLNYALHGEVNGAVLHTGDFLHVKPHGAAALALAVGMTVKGSGTTKPMIGGYRVIEAEVVNGVKLEKKPKAKKKAHH